MLYNKGLKFSSNSPHVADEYDVTDRTVRSTVSTGKDSTLGEFSASFDPLLYNIWNLKDEGPAPDKIQGLSSTKMPPEG
jgi:hypothetical protein